LNQIIDILNNKVHIEQKLIDGIKNNKNLKDSLYEISQIIFGSNKIDHPTRLKCHLELIKLSKLKKSTFSTAHNLNLSSRIYSVLGKTRQSIKNDFEALKLWNDIKSEPLSINGKISSYANIGNTYNNLGLYNKSIDYFEKGLKSLKYCNNDLIPYIRIHLGLGNVYNNINRYKKAEQYFIKAFNESKKSKDDLITIPCEMGIINSKMKYKDYRSVINLSKKILIRINKLNDVVYKASVLLTLGTSYMNLKKYNKSEKYYLKHLELFDQMKSIEHKASSYKNLGILYFKMKNNTKSLLFFQKSYNIHCTNNSIQSHYEILKYLSLLYDKSDNKSKALSFYKLYVKHVEKNNKEKDKLFKIDKQKIIKGLESELSVIKYEKDILSERIKKNRSRNSKISTSLLHITNNQFLEEIIMDIRSKKISNNNIINKINININKTIDWVDYLKAYEQLNKTFIQTLNNYKLSITEIKICSFIKIGFDNHQISGILNISLRAVQQNRYRIKKKLKLKNKLDHYLLSLTKN